MKSYSINRKFPKNFLWGTSTAAHQVEGRDTNSDWWGWEKRKKSIPDTGIAIDEYRLFKKDIQLMKHDLNNNSGRLSLEWSRIFPEEGKINQKALNHYLEVLTEMKKNGLKTIITLHHFTNPRWFSKKGGWEKRGNINHFLNFINICIEWYSPYIDYWIVVNEPNVYSTMSYLIGLWPPEENSIIKTLRVYKNLLEAHKRAYVLIHTHIPHAMVGSAVNMVCYKGKSVIEKLFTKISEYVFNFSFIELSKNYWDFIGINYYYLHFISSHDLISFKAINRSVLPSIFAGLRGDIMWPNYPEGMFILTQSIWNRYKKPIIITENGLANTDEGIRKSFLINNLIWLERSIKKGANVLGYFYWSFADNIEWTLGKKIKFGLYNIDYRTLRRVKTPTAEVYSKIAKDNAILI